MIEVTLAPYECMLAAQVGIGRQLSAINKGLRMAFGLNGPGWNEHIEGAAGEMATAKALNVFWDGSVDTFKRPDVGQLQIRTRTRHDWDLIVRKGDADDECFLLVTGTMPNFRVHGFLLGRDAKQETWLQSYAGRTPAYFVPKEHLLPLSALPALTIAAA